MFLHKKLFILVLALCFVLSAKTIFAGGDTEWRPITAEERDMKTPKVEPNADAEAIFWEVRIDDSSSYKLSRDNYVRVKIFTERGREKYSKFDIPFTRGYKIRDIAARIIRPDGTIVEIDKKDIFEREIIKANKVKIKAKSFAIPNIEPGVIVEYRYREVIQDAGAKGTSLEFQHDIPVQTLSYYYKPYNKKEPEYQPYNFTDTKFVKDEKGFYLAQRKNIPALKEEPQMPPSDTVRPWMLLTGSSLQFSNVSAFAYTIVFKDVNNPNAYWGAVGQQYSELVKFMNKPNKDVKNTANELTASASTPEEKLAKLYEFSQTQIKNVDFDPALTDEQKEKMLKFDNFSNTLKSKVGNSQIVDMLFGALANSLGYETRIAFSANRNKMFFEPSMTNENFIHPAAIAVKVNNQWKFYNPGMAFLPAGMLVWYEEDVYAMLLGEKELNWVKTPLTSFEKNASKRTGRFKLLEDGTLEGTVKIEDAGQSGLDDKLDKYEDSANQREEEIKDEIKGRISTAEVSELQIENITDPSKPFVYQYKVRVPNYAQRTGKRLFLQPGFFEYGEKTLFSTTDRKYDIYFSYPWSENDDIEIELPKGFALDNADAPAELADPGRIGDLKLSLSLIDNSTLRYKRHFHFGNGANLFPASAYPNLKTMFDEFHKADSHTITLKQN